MAPPPVDANAAFNDSNYTRLIKCKKQLTDPSKNSSI